MFSDIIPSFQLWGEYLLIASLSMSLTAYLVLLGKLLAVDDTFGFVVSTLPMFIGISILYYLNKTNTSITFEENVVVVEILLIFGMIAAILCFAGKENTKKFESMQMINEPHHKWFADKWGA